eukprot:6429027-Alexandrium_andersonii.AAC.1
MPCAPPIARDRAARDAEAAAGKASLDAFSSGGASAMLHESGTCYQSDAPLCRLGVCQNAGRQCNC